MGVNRIEELCSQVQQLEKEIQDAEESYIHFEAPGQMVNSASWRDRPPGSIGRGRGNFRGSLSNQRGSFRGIGGGSQNFQPPDGPNVNRSRRGAQNQKNRDVGPCYVCRGKHLARDCIFKDTHQILSDGRSRYKRNVTQKVNNVKVPTLMWFYPDENVAEEIDEYEELDESTKNLII